MSASEYVLFIDASPIGHTLESADVNVFKEYKGRPMGQDILNRKLQIYGVKIITVREFKRNENRNRTFWKLIRI